MNAYHQVMRRMRWVSVGAVLVVSAGVPAIASAAVLAPPGHAGANQYFETIPTAAGNAAPPGSVRGSGSGNPGRRALSGFGRGASTDGELAKLGKDGQAAAALAAATAPTLATPAEHRAAASTSAGSVGDAILHTLSGSDTGGLGVALPLLLATALVAALGLLFARRGHGPRRQL